MSKHQLKLPPQYTLAVYISGGITAVCSVVYIVLCILALIFRFDCSAGDIGDANGAQYFLTTNFRVYIQDIHCDNAIKYGELTQSYAVFVMVTLTLSFAVLSFATAVTLMSVAVREDTVQYVNICVYVYICVYVASLVVDLTLGIHFGMDFSTLGDELIISSPGLGMNYEKDVVRLGAFILMTIALKGFVVHILNIALLILLVVYTIDYQKQLQESEHSIHNMGAIHAFERSKRYDDPWTLQNNDMFYTRGSHLNPAYNHDEEPQRRSMRQNTVSDSFNYRSPADSGPTPKAQSTPYHRPESWLHTQQGPGIGSRPFSYLEEPKRPVPVKPPVSPKTHQNEPHWRRDAWPPAPPVPNPDYSPPTPRRLKSALKGGYP